MTYKLSETYLASVLKHHQVEARPYLTDIFMIYFGVLSYIVSDTNVHELSRMIAKMVYAECEKKDKRIFFGIGLEQVLEIEVTSKPRYDSGMDVMVVLPCLSVQMNERRPAEFAGIVAQSLYSIAGYLGYSIELQARNYKVNECMNSFEADFLRGYYETFPLQGELPISHARLFYEYPVV